MSARTFANGLESEKAAISVAPKIALADDGQNETMPVVTSSRLIDAQEAMNILGIKKSAFYDELKASGLPKPVERGNRYSRWPVHEIHAIRVAWTAGASELEVRTVIAKLESSRSIAMEALNASLGIRTSAD